MSVVAHLCGLTKHVARTVVVRCPPEVRAAEAEARGEGLALVEPDLPIGRLKLPRDAVERAVLATVVRGRARELLFVRGHGGGVVKVRDAAVLDLAITMREHAPAASPLGELAMTILVDRSGEPMAGKELLREVRARRSASASDAAELAKAVVRAWNDGLLDLSLR